MQTGKRETDLESNRIAFIISAIIVDELNIYQILGQFCKACNIKVSTLDGTTAYTYMYITDI